ncbi:hypothetical protein CHARACLAT_033026 [Characodon lateralis]|uniref:Uncharacterized protein n=1 Tax=Characodon lateralis TaxID=208331 RepID=A0ABU7F981_9TELE|nr:hypothetical protein [Characodon lateralis]
MTPNNARSPAVIFSRVGLRQKENMRWSSSVSGPGGSGRHHGGTHGRTSALRCLLSGRGRGGGKAESSTGRRRFRQGAVPLTPQCTKLSPVTGRDLIPVQLNSFNHPRRSSRHTNQTHRKEINAFERLHPSTCS